MPNTASNIVHSSISPILMILVMIMVTNYTMQSNRSGFYRRISPNKHQRCLTCSFQTLSHHEQIFLSSSESSPNITRPAHCGKFCGKIPKQEEPQSKQKFCSQLALYDMKKLKFLERVSCHTRQILCKICKMYSYLTS